MLTEQHDLQPDGLAHKSERSGRHMRVISHDQPDESAEYKCQRILYQAFVNEMLEIVAPLGVSMDANRLGVTFCEACDGRVAPYLNRPVENDALLERQLRFEPVRSGDKVLFGNWTIHRFWRAGFSSFPSCEKLARETAEKLIRKLSAFGRNGVSFSAREVTYKVQKSFVRKRVRWAEEEDLKGKVTFLPQLAHVNEASSSSPIRLVVVPNREVWINEQLGSRSYNSFVRRNTVELPRFTTLSLVTALSMDSLFVDIEDCYGCLRNSAHDARQAIVFCLKTEAGLPSYDLNQCPDGVLHALVQASSSFGQADVSRFSQMALSRMATTYQQYCASGEVNELLLQDIDAVLKMFSYADDSQIPALTHKVLRWSSSQGRSAPKPGCLCSTPCEDWSCSTIDLTSENVAAFDSFIKAETESYLVHLAVGFVKVANFNQHFVKFISGTTPRMQEKLGEVGATTGQLIPSLDLKSDLVRPSPEQLKSEVGGKVTMEEDNEGGIAGQLGKSYTDTEAFLKTQKLYVCHYVGKSKRRTPAFGDYDGLRQHCASKNVRISKISLSSLAGCLWDPAGVHLCQVRAYVKEAARIHLRNGPVTWQEPASDQVEKMFWKAVEVYFLICKLPHPRSRLLVHPSARLALVGSSDGGEHLQSIVVTGLSSMVVDGRHVGKAQHLHLANYANNASIVLDMPLVELVAFHKMLVVYTQVLTDLKSLGIQVPPSSCFLTIDSKTVLIQIRTRAHLYQKKVAGLITRIQLLLARFDLCPFSQVYWIDQKALPEGSRYHADILSKTRQEKTTPAGVMKDFSDLHSMDYLECLPASQWPWIHRDVALPHMADSDLISDLKIDEDHLQQIKEFLERPTVTSSAAFAHASGVAATAPLLDQRQSDIEKGEVVGERGSAAEGSGELAQSPPDSLPAPSSLPAHPVPLTDPPHVSTQSAEWREAIGHLIARKRMFGLGARSVVSVLAWVLRFIASLKRRRALRKLEPVPVNTADKCHWPRHVRPWCGKILCGLGEKGGCGHPHPRVFSSVPEYDASEEYWVPARNNAHHLLMRQSTVGFNLGHPETLHSVVQKLGEWETGEKVVITHSEWRALAFDYLCFLFQGHFELRGYSVVRIGSKWGVCI